MEDNCHCLYRLCKNTTRCSSFSSKVYSCAVIKLFRTNIVRNRLCAVCLSDLAPGEEDVRKKVEVVAGQVKKEAFDEKKWFRKRCTLWSKYLQEAILLLGGITNTQVRLRETISVWTAHLKMFIKRWKGEQLTQSLRQNWSLRTVRIHIEGNFETIFFVIRGPLLPGGVELSRWHCGWDRPY